MISSGNIPHGPYRATKLWNEVVRLFRAGMPVRKHRYLLKSHPNSFTAAEAVDWLHSLLVINKNFGPTVTRSQTIQLLRKFLKNHVIEDVCGKWGSEDFHDNNQLFRFYSEHSPTKNHRMPLKTLNNEKPTTNVRKCKSFKDELLRINPVAKTPTLETSKSKGNGGSFLQKATASEPRAVAMKMENIWKDCLLYRLKKVLHLGEIIDIMPEIQADNIAYNTSTIGPSGVVTVEPSEDIPCWILSAMKCLSNWPYSTDCGLPCYAGFEKDVFKAVLDYFHAAQDPLLTFSLYELFTTVLVRCELLDEMCTGASHTVAVQEKESLVQRDEISKIHKQLMQAQMRHENLAIRRERSSRGRRKKQLVYDENMKVPPCEKNNNNSSRLVPGGNPVKSGLTGRNLFRSVQNLDVLNEENFERLNSFPMKPALSQQSIYVGNNNSDLVDQLMDSDGENNNQQQVLAGEWHDPATNPDDFSSVEDLLVNMSHTMRSELELNLMADEAAPNTASTIIEATARGHTNNRHSWRSCDDEMAPLLSDDCYEDIKPQACSYDRDTNLNYRSLPRSRQMKIKKPAESDPTFFKKQPCKSELYKCKSQSSIIARREVPPPPIETDVNRVKTRIMRLPFVSESLAAKALSRGSSVRNIRTYVNTEQWSRSHYNLTEISTDCNKSNRKSWSHDTPVKGQRSGIEGIKVEPNSPLSDALNLAKRQLSIIETNSKEQKHLQEAFQLCLLLVPPGNRRKLHLLFRMMTKMLSNPHLISIDDEVSTRALLIDKFTDCVIRHRECDPVSKVLQERVFIFLLDHSSSVFIVHEDLKNEVLEKQKNVDLLLKVPEKKVQNNPKSLKRQYTFCKQVTKHEFEEHGLDTEHALLGLLRGIVADKNLDTKEKRKKLKQFQKSYPEIFSSQFPNGFPPLEVAKTKKQPLLSGALNRLRNLRL